MKQGITNFKVFFDAHTKRLNDCRKPGHARHPRGESAGLVTLRAAFTEVIADHLGQPQTMGKEGEAHAS
jgi:hypothetical protein